MQKIKGTSTTALSNTALKGIVSEGRGRDRQKAIRELNARIKRRGVSI